MTRWIKCPTQSRISHLPWAGSPFLNPWQLSYCLCRGKWLNGDCLVCPVTCQSILGIPCWTLKCFGLKPNAWERALLFFPSKACNLSGMKDQIHTWRSNYADLLLLMPAHRKTFSMVSTWLALDKDHWNSSVCVWGGVGLLLLVAKDSKVIPLLIPAPASATPSLPLQRFTPSRSASPNDLLCLQSLNLISKSIWGKEELT